MGCLLGEVYNSQWSAAAAWGMEFNGESIASNREYASVIYQNGSGYSYTSPTIGGTDTVSTPSTPDGTSATATIHSHGAYKSDYYVDDYSYSDISNAKQRNIDSYLTTPDGSLLVYSVAFKRIIRLSKKMPYDRNHPNPQNPNPGNPSNPE